ncbi:MAG: hypothetical protein H0W70_03155 [Actinobacteria bacterium]|nr:hypothetical protein [Actinomycetota bacterium]
MSHSERTLAAFLVGDLDPVDAAEYDRHILECDACWTAVHEDRRGRDRLDTLREPAPARLADAVRQRVEAAAARRPQPRRPARIVATVVCVTVIVLAGAVTATRVGGPHRDPAVLASVVAAAADRSGVALPSGVTLDRLVVDGHAVVLARSAALFPMPPGGHPVNDADHAPWIAARGEVNLLCFSRPTPALLAGRVPAAELTGLARALGLQSS